MGDMDAWMQWAIAGGVGAGLLYVAIRAVLARTSGDSDALPGSDSGTVDAPSEADRLRVGLQRTRSEGFLSRLTALFGTDGTAEAALEEMEAVLYTADIGVKTSERLLASIRDGLPRDAWRDESRVMAQLRAESGRILASAGAEAVPPSKGQTPRVIMMVGVNGAGKTTTIGKLASQMKGEGKRVLLAAGDTFRAAAVEQLEVWAQRVGVDLWKGKEGADPASVLFEAVQHACAEGHDVVLADTSGRLHTDANLMRELEKIHRVLGKARADAPDEVLLVLDATMGQNAIQQARQFREVVSVTGLVLTKLDGTARGGVVLGICEEMKVPILHVGVGERVEDLRPFSADGFVEALFARSDAPSGP
jgi:fused signal recognition particle receptor